MNKKAVRTQGGQCRLRAARPAIIRRINMNYEKLAEILFPHITKTPDDYEKLYPKRELPEGAKVTRLGPSPTGFNSSWKPLRRFC